MRQHAEILLSQVPKAGPGAPGYGKWDPLSRVSTLKSASVEGSAIRIEGRGSVVGNPEITPNDSPETG